MKEYFDDPWQYVDWMRILTGLTYVVMYLVWGRQVLD
jgi:hypothetical protein